MATQTQTVTDASIPVTSHPHISQEYELSSMRESTERNTTSSGNDSPTPVVPASKLQKVAVTFQLSGINFATSCVNGLIVVGLPKISQDLDLPASLAFWPASVGPLATTSTLLLAGALADVLGPRSIDLIGNLASGALMLASGWAQKGEQLVGMRAVQGVGLAMHLASSVALITKIMPRGRSRNIAFSCLGLSQPLGFSFGLVVGGVLVDTVGWRAGWYLYGGFTLVLSAVGFFSLPKSEPLGSWKEVVQSVREKVDWVGALLASCFMAFLSYFLAIISADIYKIRDAGTIVFLCLGVCSLPLFVAWVHRQVRNGKPALIPNSLWKNTSFSSICGTTALSFAVLNSLELFASLFFQEVQQLSALQAALRILPSLVVGVILNFTTGLLVHKIPAMWIIIVSSLVSAGSPLLMAVIQPQWPYWFNAFFAQLLMPVSVDILFTVGLIVVTNVFPEDKQAVAGAVFNTASQFGCAFGLAIMQVISTLVSRDHEGMRPVEALMEGYRASFWTMFAVMLTCAVIGGLGLRKSGKVGLKTD